MFPMVKVWTPASSTSRKPVHSALPPVRAAPGRCRVKSDAVGVDPALSAIGAPRQLV